MNQSFLQFLQTERIFGCVELDDIEISTVDEFQGRKKEVINNFNSRQK